MKRRKFIGTIMAVMAAVYVPCIASDYIFRRNRNIRWIGEWYFSNSHPSYQDFNNPDNWQGGIVPGVGDNAIIDNGATVVLPDDVHGINICLIRGTIRANEKGATRRDASQR